MFFIMKAHVFCIFVVIGGEGQSLESLWRYPTHEWYIPPVRPFLTNLQAVRSCLWPVRTLHNPWQIMVYAELYHGTYYWFPTTARKYPNLTLPEFFASSTPSSDKSASNQPVNLFALFHSLSPCLIITTLYTAILFCCFFHKSKLFIGHS